MDSKKRFNLVLSDIMRRSDFNHNETYRSNSVSGVRKICSWYEELELSGGTSIILYAFHEEEAWSWKGRWVSEGEALSVIIWDDLAVESSDAGKLY
jgi:hypothetical protein